MTQANKWLLLTNPGAAQSVLRPLCSLPGLAAEPHVMRHGAKEVSDTSSILADSIRDLEETVSDLRDTPYPSIRNAFQRLAHQLELEPLAGFLRAALPEVVFDTWHLQARQTVGSMVGSGTLDWPVNRSERVAMQLALCRRIAAGSIDVLQFMVEFSYAGNNLTDNIRAFASRVLNPMLRDLKRLTESRAIPPVLFDALIRLPGSGDATLDRLMVDANNG